MDLSIIIVNYNSGGYLLRCLESLREFPPQSPYEIFVVDNGSEEGDLNGVEESHPEIKVIRNSKNLGFARANNQAVARSSGRYLLLLNPDTLLTREGLDGLLQFMEEHLEAGAAGPLLLYPDGTRQPSFRKFPKPHHLFFGRSSLLTRLFPKNPFSQSYLLMDLDGSIAREVDWITGACMILRREAFTGVGGFDEEYFLFVEDLDLCYRLHEKNWKIYFVPDVHVIHHYGGSFGIRRRQSLKEHHMGIYRYFYKHHRVPFPVKGILSLGLLMKLALITFQNGRDARER